MIWRAPSRRSAAGSSSQGIGLADGGFICSRVAGYAVGVYANDPKHFHEGVELMSTNLELAALDAFMRQRTKSKG